MSVKRKTNRPTRRQPESVEERMRQESSQFLTTDPVGLRKTWIDSLQGFGLVTENAIEKGSFIVNYRGPLIDDTEGDIFIYAFRYGGKSYCIDARDPESGLGRFINDMDRYVKANCKANVTVHETQPIISFTAIRDIQAGKHIFFKLPFLQPYFTTVFCGVV